MTQTLAIGPFTEDEQKHLASTFDSLFLTTPDALSDLDKSILSGIKAVAYKGHKAFGAAEMAQLPNLGIIANFGVGYDAIDVTAASARDIRVTNTPDVLNDDVADLAVGMILMQSRRMEAASGWVRSGNWAKVGDLPLNRKVTGARAGILGLGRIGQEIATRLTAFKMDIHYWARSDKGIADYTYHESPAALAAAVDYLIVTLVGGPATENFVDAAVLKALGPNGVLINVSRGSTVDETALLAALNDGTLGGAGLDVFRNEPNIDPRFLDADNVVLQPHQGSGTVETRADMARLQRDNITAFLNAEALPTAVN